MGWDGQPYSHSVNKSMEKTAGKKRAGAFSPCTGGHYRGSTHLQKLNKTCRGQTIPEAVRPLSEQRHEEERIMERDKAVR